MWFYLFGGAAAIVSGIYWFYFRDDGRFDEPEDIIIKPAWEYNLAGPAKEKSKVKAGGIPVKILFYSQTGTAEDFSRRLSEDMGTYGFSPEVIDVEEYDTEELQEEKLVVFVVATYGEGDPPDNAMQFHEWLMSSDREEGMLSNAKYSVFGLGNRSYDNYNVMGRQVDSKLEALGAKRIYPVGDGDDDANIENDFLVWKRGFGIALCEAYSLPPPDAAAVAEVKRRQKMISYNVGHEKVKGVDVNNTHRWRPVDRARVRVADAKNPFLANIVKTLELHTSESDRSCLHVELSTHDGLLSYQPGDHLGIYPENDLTLVHKLASLLDANLEQIISVHPVDDTSGRNALVGPCTLKAALLQYYDITSIVKKQQIRVLVSYTDSEDDKAKILKLSSDDPEEKLYDEWVVRDQRNIIEILKEFKSAKVPLDHFLEVLPKMQPRYYSISSSPNAHPDTVHLTAVLIDYVTPTNRKVQGVTTSWLSKHKPEKDKTVRIPAFIRKSNFKLAPLSSPIIMVGPGTGLAPFIGFIQERHYQRNLEENKNVEKGETVLFFGCRHPNHDYIYQIELEKYKSEETLSELIVAFSRFTDCKVYVQHKMADSEISTKLWNILESGGYIYICGDARLMARDVYSAFIDIIMKKGGKTKEEAEKYIENMQTNNRYLADVWS